jgi:hypothetical protein
MIGLLYALFFERKYVIFALWVQLIGFIFILLPYLAQTYFPYRQRSARLISSSAGVESHPDDFIDPCILLSKKIGPVICHANTLLVFTFAL